MVIKDLKEILKNNVGKWISIEFFSPSGVVGEVVGILRGFTDNYVMIENVSMNYLNMRAVVIGKIEVRDV